METVNLKLIKKKIWFENFQDDLVTFSACSLPIVFTGIYLLLRFIKTYKPLDQEVNNER